jgi:hypothetical protein
MTSVDASALRARNLLITLFVTFCALDVVLVILASDMWAIARVLLNIVVMVFVVRGRKWAKWLLIVLLGLSAFALAALLILLGSELSGALVIGSLLLLILSLLIPIYLVTNANLKRYLSQQRQLRAQASVIEQRQ